MSIQYTCRSCGDVFDSETVRGWSLCVCPACRGVPEKPASDLKCCRCGDKLTSMFYGAGDGTGQKFACPHCYWRGEADSLRAQLAAARAEGEAVAYRCVGLGHSLDAALAQRDRYAEALTRLDDLLWLWRNRSEYRMRSATIEDRAISETWSTAVHEAEPIARAALKKGKA